MSGGKPSFRYDPKGGDVETSAEELLGWDNDSFVDELANEAMAIVAVILILIYIPAMEAYIWFRDRLRALE